MKFAALASASLAGAFVFAAPSQAQDDTTPDFDTPELVAQLFACRDIADDSERLACFDREVSAMQGAQESKELVIVEKEQVEQTRKGLFGFALPKIGLFKGDGGEDEISDLETTLVSARRMNNGRYSFVVEGGARWIQTDKTPVLRTPKAGDPVTIKKGAIGSYMVKFGKARAFRARRVE